MGLALWLMWYFSKLRGQYESKFPSCSAFTSKLSNNEAVNLALKWHPVEQGLQCLCITRKQLITEQ
jgi:hypothetical protein